MAECNKYECIESKSEFYLLPKSGKWQIIFDTTKFLMWCVECEDLVHWECKPQIRQDIIRFLDSNKK